MPLKYWRPEFRRTHTSAITTVLLAIGMLAVSAMVLAPQAAAQAPTPDLSPSFVLGEPETINTGVDLGYGVHGRPEACGTPFPVQGQFVATSNSMRVTVTDDEVSLKITSPDNAGTQCISSNRWDGLNLSQVDAVLGDEVPNAVALGLNITAVIPTIPGDTYYLGWVSEDAIESVVITDADPVKVLDHGVATVMRRTNPGTPGSPDRNCPTDFIKNLNVFARFTATSEVTRLSATDNEVIGHIWNVSGGPAHCAFLSGYSRLTDANRAALLGTIDLSNTTRAYDNFTSTITFDTIPGEEYLIAWDQEDGGETVVVTESTDPAEVSVTVTCLAGNGRVDVNLFNRSRLAVEYRLEIGSLARAVTVQPDERGRVTVTGRADGPLPISVFMNGNGKSAYDPIVACDGPAPQVSSPEVRVVNACQAGNGFALFQFANPTAALRSYIIEFEGVPNRSTTAAPFGAAVRGVSGRPNGTYGVTVTAPGAGVVFDGDVTIVC